MLAAPHLSCRSRRSALSRCSTFRSLFICYIHISGHSFQWSSSQALPGTLLYPPNIVLTKVNRSLCQEFPLFLNRIWLFLIKAIKNKHLLCPSFGGDKRNVRCLLSYDLQLKKNLRNCDKYFKGPISPARECSKKKDSFLFISAQLR